jgi:Bacterial Ig-like domain
MSNAQSVPSGHYQVGGHMTRTILVGIVFFAAACADEQDGGTTPPTPMVEEPDRTEPDRTPPAVVSRYPSIGDANGFASGPYRVTFTEPLDPSTVQESAVRLWQITGSIPATLALSPDGRVLTIRPAVAPRLPGWLWVELTTELKDRAGNALVPDTTPWIFEVPVWVQPGGPGPISPPNLASVGPASLAIGADDEPVVGMGTGPNPVVRFAEGVWVPLPNPPSLSGHGSFVVGDDEGGIWRVDLMQVSRFTAAGWSPVGDRLQDTNAYVQRLAVRARHPVFLWVDYLWADTEFTPASLRVRGWNGTAWVPWADETRPANRPSLGVGPTGAIVASWRENSDAHVAWVAPVGLEHIKSVANVGPVVGFTAATTDLDGNPIVVLAEEISSGYAVRAKVWTGSGWRQIGEDLSLSRSFPHPIDPAIAVAANGLPVVAWTEGPIIEPVRRLYVARFDGSNWQRLGDPLNVNPDRDVSSLALALDRSGAPVLAWSEATVTGPVIYVKRLNR